MCTVIAENASSRESTCMAKHIVAKHAAHTLILKARESRACISLLDVLGSLVNGHSWTMLEAANPTCCQEACDDPECRLSLSEFMFPSLPSTWNLTFGGLGLDHFPLKAPPTVRFHVNWECTCFDYLIRSWQESKQYPIDPPLSDVGQTEVGHKNHRIRSESGPSSSRQLAWQVS